MTWRWITVVLASLWLLGCGETTLRPFLEVSDGGVDAAEDDAGEDDAGEDDADEDGGVDDDEDGGVDDDVDGGEL
jgi:hypothetical protein